MRVRRRHRRARETVGSRLRAIPLSQAAWHRICATTFALSAHPQGITLEHPGFPESGDEGQAAHLCGVEEMAVLATQPEDFGPALSGDELLAWLEHGISGGQLH